MKKYSQKAKILGLLFLTLSLIVTLSLSAHSGLANAQNKTLMQPTGIKSMATNATSIILVHGGWGDGSSWTQEIPILEKAGHRVIAVQLPLHSLADDVATVKRAIDFIGGPVVLVGHSYGGMVITNAGYNNPNVKGLVYVAAFGPNEGQSLGSFVSPSKFPKDFLMPDKAGLAYINPKLFHDWFAQDVNPARADVMAVVQKPFNLSIFAENSGPPAWKQLPTWYQVSENDRMIPPAVEHMFAKQMNATTISLPASHASLESHPNEIAQLILNATKGIK
ncbi:MAG: alpha/beta hydrolase [Thermoproteota archaeon]|nr:alpha/beta hydrolase [Thermoproteota archaeon]